MRNVTRIQEEENDEVGKKEVDIKWIEFRNFRKLFMKTINGKKILRKTHFLQTRWTKNSKTWIQTEKNIYLYANTQQSAGF